MAARPNTNNSNNPLERKKREREEYKPVLEAFSAVVDVTNPSALLSFLTPYGVETVLPNTVAAAASDRRFTQGATSCVTLPTAPPAPNESNVDLVAPQKSASTPNAEDKESTYLKIDHASIVKLCSAANVSPVALKKALLAYCPRAVTFERSGRAEVETVPSAGSPADGEGEVITAEADADDEGDLSPAELRAKRFDHLPWSTNVGDLIFVFLSVSAPSDVRERRRLDATQHTMGSLSNGPVDAADVPPLIRHYRRLFADHFTAAGEADAFFKALAEPLPMALRLHRTDAAMYAFGKHMLVTTGGTDASKGIADAVTPVAWLAQTAATRGGAGSYVCEAFSCSHETYHAHPDVMSVCKTLHSAAALSFQELVSMIPVLGLGIKGHHRLLDMCAAPGSKTLLAVDMAYAESGGRPLGMVWANEKDHAKAMQTLPARMKRHHAANVVTTKCDATQLPMMFRPDPSAPEGVSPVRFDRIICDVPCSGDGTVRKERSLISTWNERYIESLVPTQIRLLRRGLELLEEGGVLAYSTCSLNPKEDEEVLFEVLKNYSPASLELLSVREALHSTYDGALDLSCFPTGNGVRVTPTAPCSESPTFRGHRSQDLPLLADKIAASVLRVLPHTHNTGGFFVALIKKITHTSPASQLPPKVATKLNNWTGHKRYRVLNTKGCGEEGDAWRQIFDFYGIPEVPTAYATAVTDSALSTYGGLPLAKADDTVVNPKIAASVPYFYQLVPTAFLSPDGKGQLKRIQLVTPVAADWVMRVRPYKGPSVDLVLAGARAFELYDGSYLSNAACRWRVVSEAAAVVAEVATKRKVIIDLSAGNEDVRSFVKTLFTTGFVVLNEAGLSSLESEALRTAESIDGASLAESAGLKPAVAHLLADLVDTARKSWLVGGVLIGIKGGVDKLEDNVWWLSASLSGRKLELTVDISCRAFGLTVFFGMIDPFLGGRGPVQQNNSEGDAADE